MSSITVSKEALVLIALSTSSYQSLLWTSLLINLSN
jgi:hypothetical protein